MSSTSLLELALSEFSLNTLGGAGVLEIEKLFSNSKVKGWDVRRIRGRIELLENMLKEVNSENSSSNLMKNYAPYGIVVDPIFYAHVQAI